MSHELESLKSYMGYNVRKGKQSADGRGEKFRTFEDLEVYRVAREFRKKMYVVTRRLPDFEKYDLGSQIRRAAVSLTNNMAEGHGRYHYPDQTRFFLHSRGSLEELMDDLNICLDEDYLSSEDVAKLKEQALDVLNLINGYVRYLRGRSTSIREDDSEAADAIDDLPL